MNTTHTTVYRGHLLNDAVNAAIRSTTDSACQVRGSHRTCDDIRLYPESTHADRYRQRSTPVADAQKHRLDTMTSTNYHTLHRLYLGHTDQTFKFAHAEHSHFMRVTYMVPATRCHSTDAIGVDFVRGAVSVAMEFKANEEIFMQIECARGIWEMLRENGWT